MKSSASRARVSLIAPTRSLAVAPVGRGAAPPVRSLARELLLLEADEILDEGAQCVELLLRLLELTE